MSATNKITARTGHLTLWWKREGLNNASHLGATRLIVSWLDVDHHGRAIEVEKSGPCVAVRNPRSEEVNDAWGGDRVCQARVAAQARRFPGSDGKAGEPPECLDGRSERLIDAPDAD